MTRAQNASPSLLATCEWKGGADIDEARRCFAVLAGPEAEAKAVITGIFADGMKSLKEKLQAK